MVKGFELVNDKCLRDRIFCIGGNVSRRRFVTISTTSTLIVSQSPMPKTNVIKDFDFGNDTDLTRHAARFCMCCKTDKFPVHKIVLNWKLNCHF